MAHRRAVPRPRVGVRWLLVPLALTLDAAAAFSLTGQPLPKGVIVPEGVLVAAPLLVYGVLAVLAFRNRPLGVRLAAAAILLAIHAGLVGLHTVGYVALWSLPVPAALRLAHRWSPLIPLLQLVWVPLLALPLATLAQRRLPAASRRSALTPTRRDVLASRAPHAAGDARAESDHEVRVEPGGLGLAPVAAVDVVTAVPSEPGPELSETPVSGAEVAEVSTVPPLAPASGGGSLAVAPAPTWFDDLVEAPTRAGVPALPSGAAVDEAVADAAPAALPVAEEPIGFVADPVRIPAVFEPMAVETAPAALPVAEEPVAAGTDEAPLPPAVESVAPGDDQEAIPVAVAPIALGDDEAAMPVEAGLAAADDDGAAIPMALELVAEAPASSGDMPEDGSPGLTDLALATEAAVPGVSATEAPSPATEPPLDLDLVARVFAPYGPLLSRDRVVVVDWTPGPDVAVVCVAPKEMSRDHVIRLAARLAHGLTAPEARSAPGPVRGLSLRGPQGVVVVTPLEGAVLVAAARRRGALALLEVLSRRVGHPERREESGNGGPGVAVPVSVTGPALVDLRAGAQGPPPGAEDPAIASTVRVETPTAWVDVVASPQVEAEPVGMLAARLVTALADGEVAGAAEFHTLSVELSAHRLVIHPIHLDARPPRFVAVVGRPERPGLLGRRAEQAARTLREAS
jgi:hypothetical protein